LSRIARFRQEIRPLAAVELRLARRAGFANSAPAAECALQFLAGDGLGVGISAYSG
jgi:hypothetical protein